MFKQVRVLTKPTGDGKKPCDDQDEKDRVVQGSSPILLQDCVNSNTSNEIHDNLFERLNLGQLKQGSEAKPFNLINDRDWTIVPSEPASESNFYTNGHSALSIISVIGPKGSGKSTLLNKLAHRDVFPTYDKNKFSLSHKTRGIDIFSTHHRILLDSQPLLAPSVLENFMSGHSVSQFPNLTDSLTCSQMIDLQLTTFLLATSDYVIIVCDWLIDVHLLKLLSSAIMMIGEKNLRAKLLVYCENYNEKPHRDNLKDLFASFLGSNHIEKFFNDHQVLYAYVAPYKKDKVDLYMADETGSKFSGKSWLESCNKLWNSTIKESSMFTDYAFELADTG